jgi:hypothetical protein
MKSANKWDFWLARTTLSKLSQYRTFTPNPKKIKVEKKL